MPEVTKTRLQLPASKILTHLIKDKCNMKHILLIFITSTLTVHSMDRSMQILNDHSQSDQHEDTLQLNWQEVELEQRSTAREMNWLARLYLASGFSDRMSREFFCVNALAKINEAMSVEQKVNRCLQVGADLGGSSKIEDGSDRSANWLAANILTSCVSLMGTLIYKMSYAYPQIVFKKPMEVGTYLSNSCDRLHRQLNQAWGMEWAHECIMKSDTYDAPCNVTAARIEFKQNGKYFYSASPCCFDKIDPLCNNAIVEYMNSAYPILYAAAQSEYESANRLRDLAIKARSIPFYVVLPTVITLNILFQLAGCKYRRMVKERAQQAIPLAQELNPDEI